MAKKKKKTSKASAASKPDVKAHEDAELTAKQVRELHKKLEEERARVSAGLERHLAEAVEDIDPLADEADMAQRHAGQAYLMRFADKERKLLREIDLALNRLRVGEYGVCLGSGEPIGFARLSLRPWTRYSITYKEELEREKRERKY